MLLAATTGRLGAVHGAADGIDAISHEVRELVARTRHE
jgi:hypothetical protein